MRAVFDLDLSRRGWLLVWTLTGVVAFGGSFVAGPLFALLALAAVLIGAGPGRAAKRLEAIGLITGLGVLFLAVGAAGRSGNSAGFLLWGAALIAASLAVYGALRVSCRR